MKRVLVVSDLHVGSKQALMPPTVKTKGGGTSGYSPTQKIIYKEWTAMCRAVGHVDVLVLNGDLCDGPDIKGKGRDNWTNDLYQQCKTAADLIAMIKTDRIVGTQGSVYHTGDNVSTDELVVRDVGGDFDDDVALQVEGVRMHFSHKVGFSSNFAYRTTPIARQLLDAVINEDVFQKFDLIGRAHAHYYVEASYPGHAGFVSPCWKNRDPFGKRSSNPLNAPRLGYVWIDVEGDHYNLGKHTFALPWDHQVSWTVIK